MWVDSGGHLQRADFTKTNGGYKTSLREEVSSPFMRLLDQRELAPLAEYVPDTEFPVRADMIEVGDCHARVILLWRARLRSFSGDPEDRYEIAWPGLRVVLSKGATVVSNSTFDFEYVYPGEVLVDDINGDGMKDYVFVGGFGSVAIYIWTLTGSCLFQPLTFIERDGQKEWRSEFLEDRSTHLKKRNHGGYSIHVKGPVPGGYVEYVYRWDPTAAAFVMTRRVEKPWKSN